MIFRKKSKIGLFTLAKKIERLKHPTPSVVFRARLKEHLLAQIGPHFSFEEAGVFERLTESLRKLGEKLEPRLVFKVRTKESLLEFLEERQARFLFSRWFSFLFSKRILAPVTLICFLFILSFSFISNLPQVEAARATFLEVSEGEVTVLRGENVFEKVKSIFLEEGDFIRTLKDAEAEIFFVDDSRATLGSETEVALTSLFVNPENQVQTSVGIDLRRGKVWAQVMNLGEGKGQFRIRAGTSLFEVKNRASFDVQVEEDGTTLLRVAENLVDLKIEEKNRIRAGAVGGDLMVQIKETGEITVEHLNSLQLKEEEWWQANLVKNQEYFKKLEASYQERVKEGAGILPGSIFYPFKSLRENAKLFFVFKSEARQNSALEIAKQRFLEAQSLLQEGKDGRPILKKFKEDIRSLLENTLDPAMRKNLAEQIQISLEQSQKALETTLPNSDLYLAKEVLKETILLVSEDAQERVEVSLSSAASTLSEVQGLIESGSLDLAAEHLGKYQTDFAEVISGIKNLEGEDKKVFISKVLDQKIHDLQVLKLIEQGLKGSLAESEFPIKETKTQTLVEINQIVLQLKDRAILGLEEFLGKARRDEGVQFQVLNRLKKTVPLDFDIIQKINDIEEVYFEEGEIIFQLNSHPN